MSDVVFCFGNKADHFLIGFPGVIVKGENPVIHQDHSLVICPVFALGQFPNLFGKDKSRHHVGNHNHPVSINFLNRFLSIGMVGHGQNRIGMGMIDISEGNQRVEDGFHGRIRRSGVGHCSTLLADHFGVAESLQFRKTLQGVQTDRGKSWRFDGRQIPSAAFDQKQFLRVPKKILLIQFDRSVSAAMEHQVRVRAQKPAGVYPQFQGVVGEGLCLRVIP